MGTPRTTRRAARRLLGLALAAAIAAPGLLAAPSDAQTRTPESEPDLPTGNATFVRPNVRLPDGRAAYVHVTEEHMPLRIAIGRPKKPPKYGSTRKAREVAIEAMKMWETAIRPYVPWFRLEFVEKDPEAAVQVEWKRRTPSGWAGFGRIEAREVDGKLQVGGRMEVTTTPDLWTPLTVDEVRLLVAHEFGHVLGLGHCLDCDSAMNYSWQTRDRVLVSDLDARTFAELVSIPVGATSRAR